jgi:hypothetical protein
MSLCEDSEEVNGKGKGIYFFICGRRGTSAAVIV